MIWLGIDTANTPLSVAIVKDGELLAEENTSMAVNHSLRAMPAIEEIFQKVGIDSFRYRCDCCFRRTWFIYGCQNWCYDCENTCMDT